MENNSDNLKSEVFEHLWNGRFRMVLPMAQKLFEMNPNNGEFAIYLAWAKLENNEPIEAQKYADLAQHLDSGSIITKMISGYLQMRLSHFESAIYEFNMTEGKQKELLAWTYLNKAKSLAAIGQNEKALNFYELALAIDRNANPEWKSIRKFFVSASKLNSNLPQNKIKELFLLAKEALEKKEAWFSIVVVNNFRNVQLPENLKLEFRLLEIEAMFRLNQLTALEKVLSDNKKYFEGNEKFEKIKQALKNMQKSESENKFEVITSNKIFPPNSIKLFPNDFINLKFVKIFNADENVNNKLEQNYCEVQFGAISEIGIQVVFDNPQFNKNEQHLECFIAWYIEEDLFDQSNFNLKVPSDWDAISFFGYSSVSSSILWQRGKGRVDVFINRVHVLSKEFVVGNSFDEELPFDFSQEKRTDPNIENVEKISLVDELNKLDKIIGLSSVKKSIRELIDYLEYMKERKDFGLKSQENISVHATFLGNPGTGKTTVARMMGKIFKGMGLLAKGDVIEVDRSSLVGQYIGETAQKTEKIIESALGNVLFIDEAYTLVKKGTPNDFGQEAIDILLKRMEDKKGEFFVIVAGYPNEMNTFLESNPGLKSRFTHHFNFEDYNPNEMIEIFESMAKNDEFNITNSAKVFLHKEFTNLYRRRDSNFGNARTVRKFFEDAKLEVGKRYLSLPKHERTKEKLVTITETDIQNTTQSKNVGSAKYQAPINEELLTESIRKLNKLIGLSSVKNDVNELVKLAKYYLKNGENLSDKLTSHILFLGSPGTGKTTVARIISDIYNALGILPGGQLIETDRKGLVDAYIGKTAIKTSEVIDKSIGGTLFIDEAYALTRTVNSNDFGQEAVDTLLKRMEYDRGKFIVIAAGYTKEMNVFLESNSGLKSRFTKTFTFEDYSTNELLEIFNELSKSKKLKLDEEAEKILFKHFNQLYRERDSNFGNARLVRNTFDSAVKKRMIRLIENENNPAESNNLIIADDFDFMSQTKQKEKINIGDEEKLQFYLSELNKLTGLTSVKDNIAQLVNSLKISKIRRKKGMDVISKSLHSVFLGNPGTGKTTVARLVSNIFRELGILEKGHLVEVDRAQLVAGYSGQTAIKTDEIINKALGGTLFIDEAYTLSRGGNDFGQEAIDTLLKRMEDYKNDLVVIVAGYTNEMKSFMASNAGLTSRFTNLFTFEDYKPDELLSIANNLAKSKGYKYDDEAFSKLELKFFDLYKNRDNNFGNARTIQNIFYSAVSKQENRLSAISSLSAEDLSLIIAKDIS